MYFGGAVTTGLAGLAGRGTKVFGGTAGLNGDWGNVLEFCDFGDKTWPGTGFRAAVLVDFAGGAGAPNGAVVFVLFFGLSRPLLGCSFSLSEDRNTSLWNVSFACFMILFYITYLDLLTPLVITGLELVSLGAIICVVADGAEGLGSSAAREY